MTKPKKNPQKAGRKRFDGKSEAEVLSKLRGAYDFGATDIEACLHAGISIPALQRYIIDYPEFRAEKEQRKEKPILMARLGVVKNLNSDNPELCLKFLSKKKKKEFGDNIDVTSGGEIINIVNYGDKK